VASDAFGRGEPDLAEILIQKANQYAIRRPVFRAAVASSGSKTYAFSAFAIAGPTTSASNADPDTGSSFVVHGSGRAQNVGGGVSALLAGEHIAAMLPPYPF
jgi:hypothetical protein